MKIICGETHCIHNYGEKGRKRHKCKKKIVHLKTRYLIKASDVLFCKDYKYKDPCPPDISLKELKKKLK